MALNKVAWIYFLRHFDGAIKIGRSCDPKSRIFNQGLGEHEFIGAYLAHPAEEQDLHVKFAGQRIAGEWFRPSEELEQFINQNAGTSWDDLFPIENFRLSDKSKKARRTYGVSLNRKNPDDVRLLAVIESSSNISGLIKQALLAYLDAGGQEPVITEQELAELRARMAWLEQNQAAAPVIAAAQPGRQPAETRQVQPGGELSEVFLNGIRKIAKPGIRLGE